MQWPVPSFAPSGHYGTILTLYGKVAGGQEQSITCLTADFDL